MNEEHYLVKINYQKEDGYWVIGEEKLITILVKHFEKNNHRKTVETIKKQYLNVEIISIKYI